MNVVSCSRNTIKNGSCEIEGVVEFQKDTIMCDSVKNNIRLFFSYERWPTYSRVDDVQNGGQTTVCDDFNKLDDQEGKKEKNDIEYNKQNAESKKKSKKRKKHEHDEISEDEAINELNVQDGNDRSDLIKGTRITYSIELSYDYGPKKQLLIVEVMAPGDTPSINPAIPMDDESLVKKEMLLDSIEDEINSSNKGSENGGQKLMDSNCDLNDQIESLPESCPPNTDRYAAYIDPEQLVNFLSWTRFKMEETDIVFFLLTFPFYENEWDIVGFVINSVFGNDEDEWSDMIDNEEDPKMN